MMYPKAQVGESLTGRVKAAVRTVDGLAGGVEALALALTTRAAGWVASIPTIALTSRSCEAIFDLTPGVAVASAVALELVGQAVTNAWLRAKEWNANKRKADPPANERLALAMTTWYFATDFILVGVLQVPKALVNPVHWAALLFPLAQVISTVITGERAAQFRREADVEAVKRERKAERQAKRQVHRQAKRQATVAQVSTALSDNGKSYVNLDRLQAGRRAKRDARIDSLLTFYLDNPDAGPSDAARAVGVSRQTIYTYNAELEAAGRLGRNGNGWEVLR